MKTDNYVCQHIQAADGDFKDIGYHIKGIRFAKNSRNQWHTELCDKCFAERFPEEWNKQMEQEEKIEQLNNDDSYVAISARVTYDEPLKKDGSELKMIKIKLKEGGDIWLPRSQVERVEDVNATIWVKRWLVEKNALDK